jgi:hypothetical protein
MDVSINRSCSFVFRKDRKEEQSIVDEVGGFAAAEPPYFEELP